MFGKDYWKGFKAGFKLVLGWYFRKMKENKLYVILFILEMLLIPVKMLVVEILDLTPRGKQAIRNFANTIDWNS